MSKNKFKKLIIYIFILTAIITLTVFFNTGAADTASNSYPEYLIPGGEVIGIKLYTKGVHVIDTGYIDTVEGKKSPAQKSGIKKGDFITKINGVDVDTIEEFTKLTQDNKELNIVYYRKGKEKNTVLTPELSVKDNMFKVGIWIRDSTAGIGTVTFYDPVSNTFGALGHGINDQDTRKLLTLKNGKIYNTHLTSISKAKSGKPGELNGTFIGENNCIGELMLNTSNGVFGKVDMITKNKPYKVGKKSDVTTGKATIMCSVKNNVVNEYEIEIINVVKNSPFNNEGLTIKITDPKLLAITDGILQGMSGSPIIQGGKLVGAVTHVFVNDPTRGYGIFIENMLAEAEKIK